MSFIDMMRASDPNRDEINHLQAELTRLREQVERLIIERDELYQKVMQTQNTLVSEAEKFMGELDQYKAEAGRRLLPLMKELCEAEHLVDICAPDIDGDCGNCLACRIDSTLEALRAASGEEGGGA